MDIDAYLDEFVANRKLDTQVLVTRILYQKSGFGVYIVVNVKDGFGTEKIIGNTVEGLMTGHYYNIKCNSQYNPKYGLSWNILEAYEIYPPDAASQNAYLLTEQEHNSFLTPDEILQDLRNRVATDEAAQELTELGLKYTDARRFALKNGETSASIVKNNPYVLLDVTNYINFQDCDIIANRLNHRIDSSIRIVAAIRESIKEYCQMTGNTYSKIDDIVPTIKARLDYHLSQAEMEEIAANHSETIFDYQVFNYCDSIDRPYLIECIKNKKPYAFFETSKTAIMRVMEDVNNQDRIIYDNSSDTVMLTEMFNDENAIAEGIARLTKEKEIMTDAKEVQKILSFWQRSHQVTLTKKQEDAVLKVLECLQGGFYVINGPAGTGKTAVASAIIDVFSRLAGRHLSNRLNVLAFAPTGRAAQVLSQSCDRINAETIHRGLVYDPENNVFNYNEKNPLPNVNLLIIDEVSMLDTHLCAELIRAIDHGTKVLFLGDDRQLPSVNPGRVLRDILDVHPDVITLSEVKRNSSGILANAMSILDEDDIITTKNSAVCSLSSPIVQIDSIKKACTSALKRFSREDICVLVPMKKGKLGTINLNKVLQPIFNPNYLKSKIKVEKEDGTEICIGDKVINIKNRYHSDRLSNPKVIEIPSAYDSSYKIHFPVFSGMCDDTVTNGEIGEVVDIYKTNVDIRNKNGIVIGSNKNVTRIVVKFHNTVTDTYNYVFYDDEEDYLNLAYAITIHKSQGSTFAFTITCATKSHQTMLTNELFYVSATRASKCNFFIIDKSVYDKNIHRHGSFRETNLAAKIKRALK